MEDGSIQLIANYADWKAIKKITITEKTDPKTVAEFLASLTMSVDNKIEYNLKKIIELDKIDKAIEEVGIEKKDVAKAIEEVNSRKISKIINEITSLDSLQKNEQKELQQFCKAYAMRKTLQKAGIIIDYSEIDIPGLKRLKKIKK
jgi:D-ribose pyranose/furanose isomerase RbsD